METCSKDSAKVFIFFLDWTQFPNFQISRDYSKLLVKQPTIAIQEDCAQKVLGFPLAAITGDGGETLRSREYSVNVNLRLNISVSVKSTFTHNEHERTNVPFYLKLGSGFLVKKHTGSYCIFF